jgi:peroxiredoxin
MLAAKQKGAIVNIASVLGFGVSKGVIAYTTAKAGVVQITKALGLELDASGFGMGHRSQRFALIARNGKVTKLLVEPGPGLNASSAESVLSHL